MCHCPLFYCPLRRHHLPNWYLLEHLIDLRCCCDIFCQLRKLCSMLGGQLLHVPHRWLQHLLHIFHGRGAHWLDSDQLVGPQTWLCNESGRKGKEREKKEKEREKIRENFYYPALPRENPFTLKTVCVSIIRSDPYTEYKAIYKTHSNTPIS